ncbi:MAG TPA: VWA domain-containing protein [Chitinophagales bacterium]|nr:VWA domain-containing protein [Chitinophagales bacterium]HRK26138.1 VWA domain-containing protein [Chitinophagales bacterium]
MFQFENSAWLYALLLAPVFWLFFRASMQWQWKAMERFGQMELINRLMPDFSVIKRRNKFTLYLLAYCFIVLALANPQIGAKLEKVTRKGIDVMVALDVSKSMLAEDLQPNRLERARQLISRMIDNMKDDRIGLIIFAGNAYLQMPLTADYAAAKLFLKTVNTDIVPTQGTAIGASIELALRSFPEKNMKHNALLIISDGENHETEAKTIAEKAADEGLVIYTLGIGSPEGAPIPIITNGRKADYKRDDSGNPILSKLNETILQDIAQTGRGQYFRITGSKDEASEVLATLGNIEKRQFEDHIVTEYASQFQYFLGIALLLLLIEFFTSERKNTRWAGFNLFGEPAKSNNT